MSLEITAELIARQSPEAQVIIRLLLARVAEQDRRIAKLEARLNKTRQNSSLPPGTQHPHAKPLADRPKSNKTRGGQPGHPRHERALIPAPTAPRSSRSSPPSADVAGRTWPAPILPRSVIRCGNSLRSNLSSPSTSNIA